MHDLTRDMLRFVQRHSLLTIGETVVVGFSGGPDSVALTLILQELAGAGFPLHLHLAHLNHGLRGEESDGEEAFCRDFARQHGLAISVERADVAAEAERPGISLETAARNIRYDFLGRVAEQAGAPAVATGHHADDVAETVLLRLIRGCGLKGLGAIAPGRPLGLRHPGIRLVRPLLPVRRSALLDFLRSKGQAFCTDSSNGDTRHTRNRIRHKLIPRLKDEFPTFSVESLCALSEAAIEATSLLEALLDERWGALCAEADEERVILHAAAFAQAAPALRKAAASRALRLLAADRNVPTLRAQHYDALSDLGQAEVGTEASLPGGFYARREHGQVYFGRRQPPVSVPERELPVPGRVELPELGVCVSAELLADGQLSAEEAAGCAGEDLVHLDAGAVALPLSVRTRRPGDRFRPLGSAESTKLKSFFIARKVPFHLRDSVPLVVAAGAEIAWVVGHEISECHKLTDRSKGVLRLRVGAPDTGFR